MDPHKQKASLIVNALFHDKDLVHISCEEETKESLLGNIYIGRVQNIVSNIQAAFIEILPGISCYFSYEDSRHAIFTKKQSDKKLSIGDELLVQVNKEHMKTKAPMVTSNLNFTGKYLVLTTGNKKLGVSSKLENGKKEQLKGFMKPFITKEYGIVIRTNAKDAKKEELLTEVERLKAQYERTVTGIEHRLGRTLLYQSPPKYLTQIRDTYANGVDQIVSDHEDLMDKIKTFLSDYQPKDLEKCVFYCDDLLPLNKLYSIETRIKDLLKERVWLKSGAYLVIQQTEACVVIDVNTGKFTGKKKMEETFLKINLEAAKEIGKQLRLRNLSGIIIVDFIDMAKQEHKDLLLAEFNTILKKDPVPTNVIGMTQLNMVEVTRKKTRKSLREDLIYSCPTCHGRGYLY